MLLVTVIGFDEIRPILSNIQKKRFDTNEYHLLVNKFAKAEQS